MPASEEITALQRALRLAEARFHAVVTRSADGVMVLTQEGVIAFVNPAAETSLGRSQPELLGQCFGIPLVPGESSEINIKGGDDRFRTAELRVAETTWQDQPAYLVTLRDITALKEKSEQAREEVRRRDAFIAMLSHELRTPLAAIANAIQLIRKAADRPHLHSRAEEVLERQCRQMTRLIEDLLDISRISQGKIQLQSKRLHLQEEIRQALAAIDALIQTHCHNLQVEMPAEPIFLLGDAARLHQILINLLSNACKYTEDNGRLQLHVQRAGREAVIRIRDNGFGIEPELLARIFEPFVQADQPLARSQGGLGIGLALVRRLVHLHGGQVSAHSAGVGQGSEFLVRLPLLDETADGPSSAEQEPPSEAHPLRLRVLVVEDCQDACHMLHLLLEQEGFEVSSTSDGQQSMELLRHKLPDVAVIDIGLPKLDGYQIAECIRHLPRGEHVFLIALTGYGRPEDRQRALAAGFDVHLVKPLRFEDLMKLLVEREHS